MSLKRKIEELCEELTYTEAPSERLPLLDELSSSLRRIDPTRAMSYAREELRIASSENDQRWIARGCIQLAECERILAKYPSAQRHLKRAEEALKEVPDACVEKSRLHRSIVNLATYHKDDSVDITQRSSLGVVCARESGDLREVAAALVNHAGICFNSGKVDEGITAVEEALKIGREESLPEESADAHLIVGMVSIHSRDWETSLNHLTTSLEMYRELESDAGLAACYEKLGYLYACQDRFDKSLDYYRRSAELYSRIGNQERHALVIINIGHVHIEQKRFDRAIECIDQVIAYALRVDNREMYTFGLIGKGDMYLTLKKWKDAVDVLSEACDILREIRSPGQEFRAVRLLANAYEGAGELRKALVCHQRFIELEKELWSHAMYRILSFPRRLQVSAVDEEKKQLSARRSQLKQEAKQRIQELTAASLQVVQTTSLLDQLRKQLHKMKHAPDRAATAITMMIREIDNRTRRVDTWKTFERQLRKLDQEFMHDLIARYPELTPAEMRICSLLKMNVSNREITELLNISNRTVDTHRGRIRKKMGLKSKDSLEEALVEV